MEGEWLSTLATGMALGRRNLEYWLLEPGVCILTMVLDELTSCWVLRSGYLVLYTTKRL